MNDNGFDLIIYQLWFIVSLYDKLAARIAYISLLFAIEAAMTLAICEFALANYIRLSRC